MYVAYWNQEIIGSGLTRAEAESLVANWKRGGGCAGKNEARYRDAAYRVVAETPEMLTRRSEDFRATLGRLAKMGGVV